jgi:hypothetical protein
MAHEDCYKTAFQTHIRHCKFRVMPFGLTCTPHTFQKAMNATLALLRKCVLVFFKTSWYIVSPMKTIFSTWRRCSSCYSRKSGVLKESSALSLKVELHT